MLKAQKGFLSEVSTKFIKIYWDSDNIQVFSSIRTKINFLFIEDKTLWILLCKPGCSFLRAGNRFINNDHLQQSRQHLKWKSQRINKKKKQACSYF